MKVTFTLDNFARRKSAIDYVRTAPVGWRFTIGEPKRSDEQAERFWASLRFFAARTDHFGERLSAEAWRDIFMAALGRETKFVRGLDGEGLVPLRVSTKELSVREMSDMTELLYSEGARRGIVFPEPRLDPDWKSKRRARAA